MCFKAMKSSGFDLEKTHLQDVERLEKLILMVMIAFIWCYKTGIYLHAIKAIPIKNHGRRAKGIFKYLTQTNHQQSQILSQLVNQN